METASEETRGINEDPNQLGVQLRRDILHRGCSKAKRRITARLRECQLPVDQRVSATSAPQSSGYCFKTVMVNSVLGTVEFNG